jgi:hypothetical protein
LTVETKVENCAIVCHELVLQITYIQFNLESVPSGASVSQGTLKLYVDTVSTSGVFAVYAVNGTWTESTLNYSLAPALGV